MRINSNVTSLFWLNLTSFAKKTLTYASIFTCIICIGLYKFTQRFFFFLNWLVRFPYVFLEASLSILSFLDLRLSDGLVRFIGFVTPRAEFLTITLYVVFSIPLSLLKVLAYSFFFLFKVLSFFPWFLQVIAFAIFVPPLIYAYDVCSLIIYSAKVFYYVTLGWFYKILKVFGRSYLGLLELRALRQGIIENGRRVTTREMMGILSTLGKRFHFEQFGSVSSSKVVNYYNNSGTFDLDKYFLGYVPFSVYFNGRYEHEGGGFSSSHRLVHNAKFFYQPVKKRRLLRLNQSFGKLEANLEEPIYNAVRVFEYHRYISMGLVRNFNLDSFPEYYRLKLFSRLLRFNLVPAINFYYSMFNSTLRNQGKNPDFWIHYRRVVASPNRGLTWFEYSQNRLLKDPVFSYNNYDYSSPRFGRKLDVKLFNRRKFREISVSEGLRSSYDDYRSVTDISGRAFIGSHFSQLVDDYDHYLKTKVHYKSKMERFWFKRVLLPNSGLASDRRSGLPALLSDGAGSETYRQQPVSFFKVVFVGFFGGIVVGLCGLLGKVLSVLHAFFISLLLQLKQAVGDFIFRAYLLLIFFILRVPSLVARGRRGFAPVYKFFTYPVKVTPLSVLWAFVVFSISLSRALVSTLRWSYAFVRGLILRVYGFAIIPVDFVKFLLICIKDGNLGLLVDNELEAILKEVDDLIGWLLNDSDK